MSIELIEKEVQRFLSTEDPEAICISGHWGVGKTFAWNRFLKDSQEKRAIALPHYSYVSLFGVNSLDEFRYSIFENTVKSSKIGLEPSLETLQTNTTAAVERFGRKSLWFLQQMPLIKNYVGGLGPVWFLSVKRTIVCVDDIERRGKGLPVRDVLGLISNLKEHKQCKVVLILNDEALEEDEDEFHKYYEKVVDTSLKFAPTAAECARIALAADTPSVQTLAESCVGLGISNIRLIKKIERSVRKIEPMLSKFDEKVSKQAVQSLALLGWSVYEPSRAPSLEYLKKRQPEEMFGVHQNEAVPDNEAAWNALLDVYGFTHMDEFDLVLLNGVRDGFFDPFLVEKHASELNDKIKAATLDTSFTDAWRLYHDSFASNQDQVLDAIYQSFLKSVQNINPLNLEGTVKLLKELGRPDQAAEIIECYVATHSKDRKLFDLQSYPFGSSINDPDVVQAFREKFATFRDERDPTAILLAMATTEGWNDENIATLSTLEVDEYYSIFKTAEGVNLHRIIDACLQFDRIANASERMKEISKRAKEALRRIGQESAINARRVLKYGVRVEQAIR